MSEYFIIVMKMRLRHIIIIQEKVQEIWSKNGLEFLILLKTLSFLDLRSEIKTRQGKVISNQIRLKLLRNITWEKVPLISLANIRIAIYFSEKVFKKVLNSRKLFQNDMELIKTFQNPLKEAFFKKFPYIKEASFL